MVQVTDHRSAEFITTDIIQHNFNIAFVVTKEYPHQYLAYETLKKKVQLIGHVHTWDKSDFTHDAQWIYKQPVLKPIKFTSCSNLEWVHGLTEKEFNGHSKNMLINWGICLDETELILKGTVGVDMSKIVIEFLPCDVAGVGCDLSGSEGVEGWNVWTATYNTRIDSKDFEDPIKKYCEFHDPVILGKRQTVQTGMP